MNVENVVSHILARRDRPWLVLGKGPTSDHFETIDRSCYRIITLNHACMLCRPDICHFVDLDAYHECLSYLRSIAPVSVCLPWHPHHQFRPTRNPLSVERVGPLLSYNSTTAGKLPRHPDLSLVRLRKFSAVAAFNMLGMARNRVVYSLGVDGGTGYGRVFDPKNKLANGQTSFDVQTAEIELACLKYRMQWVRLCANQKALLKSTTGVSDVRCE